ncbi:DNA-binding protein D-ETS-4 [Cylas formicarius]|uniref:DNA-binding protein D-ETS-4 n=1 Tax=Cylas formicarius TaxID=197179 RepID=UPI002958729E|nr:DNA-binding protein D-ETS-4 [Cylas formicarius]
MVLISRTTSSETMPQTVPSALTPPFDYSNFAESFDLSLLPGDDQLISASTQLYSPTPEKSLQPKIFASFYPSSPESESTVPNDVDFGPDFQKLLGEDRKFSTSPIHLEVPTTGNHFGPPSPFSPQSQELIPPNDRFSNYREHNFYPSSPEYSVHTPSPGSIYSRSPCDEFLQTIKQESPFSNSNSPLPSFSQFGIKEESYVLSCSFSSPTSPAHSNFSGSSSPKQLNPKSEFIDLLETSGLDKPIKQESTVDFSEILSGLQNTNTLRQILQQKPGENPPQTVPEAPKDHQLLRQVLRDTSFQKRFNVKPIEFPFNGEDIKMEEPDENDQNELIISCEEQIARETIEPVLNLAIEQMRKDVDNTCTTLGIALDPTKWSPADVLSWIRWTSRQFNCPEPAAENWEMTGQELLALSEEDFTRRAPQAGMNLHAQLEIWKAAYSEDSGKHWFPESVSSNASSGDISEDEDDETHPQTDQSKPTTSKTGSHIHLWQFLKELLANPQTNGPCIRWLDRSKGIFKIEDSVKVARLWGKRKNRPAMNYDKLSRSIRQYYKKGIMKKTERSQRLVYQFCHPYSL